MPHEFKSLMGLSPCGQWGQVLGHIFVLGIVSYGWPFEFVRVEVRPCSQSRYTRANASPTP